MMKGRGLITIRLCYHHRHLQQMLAMTFCILFFFSSHCSASRIQFKSSSNDIGFKVDDLRTSVVDNLQVDKATHPARCKEIEKQKSLN